MTARATLPNDAPDAAYAAVIEGSLREVALADVLQLLDLGRKTGLLHVTDALHQRAVRLVVVAGQVCGAAAGSVPNEMLGDAHDVARGALLASERDIRNAVADALAWTGGRFSVVPLTEAALGVAPRARIGVDALLMDAARRADEWALLADRIPGPDAVIVLADEPGERGPMVSLSPDEWELVAYADGASSLRAVAERTGGDVLDVARVAHRLVGCGLLALRVAESADEPVPARGR